MKKLFRRLMWFRGNISEHNARRVIEAVLPVASLYGVDIANVDPEWFREQRTR